MADLLRTFTLMFVLLNPFLVILYLTQIVRDLDRKRFSSVMFRASLIAMAVFCVFALLGDAIFSEVIQAEFASFQIFGGIVFLLIGLQFVFKGTDAISMLRGDSGNLAGAIAMPVLIGPGTLSASVVAGKRHEPILACIVVMLAVLASVAIMILLKWLHDVVSSQSEKLVERYIETTGRIGALFVGTISIEMIMNGVRTWAEKF